MPRAPVASAMARCIMETLRSAEWYATLDPERRAEMLLMALSDALHPMGPVQIPSRGQIVTLARRIQRDAEIRATFNGRNYRELAERYGLTSRQIRRITK